MAKEDPDATLVSAVLLYDCCDRGAKLLGCKIYGRNRVRSNILHLTVIKLFIQHSWP